MESHRHSRSSSFRVATRLVLRPRTKNSSEIVTGFELTRRSTHSKEAPLETLRSQTISLEHSLITKGNLNFKTTSSFEPKQIEEQSSCNTNLKDFNLKLDKALQQKLRTLMQQCKSESKKASYILSLKKLLTSSRYRASSNELTLLISRIESMHNNQGDANPQIHDNKINLFQKALAQTTAQQNALKRYYFAINSKMRQKAPSQLKLPSFPIASRQSEVVPASKPCIQTESTSSSSYLAPGKDDYEHFRNRYDAYNANNQPLPRSSYNREFLNMQGYQPDQPILSQDSSVIHKQTAKPIGSTYRAQHLQLSSVRIDSKELDCRRDKIKAHSISFSKRPATKKLSSSFLDMIHQEPKRQPFKKNEVSPLNILQRPSRLQTDPTGQSESKSQYAGCPQVCSSEIKDARLNNMKSFFNNIVIK